MKIHIGSMKYDMSLNDVVYVNDERCCGSIASVDGIIRISKEFPLQTRKQCFWHEAVHGILNELGRYELSNDEGFVDSLSKQLYSLSERNNINKIYEKLRD